MAHFDYEGQTQKLLNYWERYHDDYVNLIPKYLEVVETRKSLGMSPGIIREKTARESWPKISLLGIKTKKAAKKKIEGMTPKYIEQLLDKIEEEFIDECSYVGVFRRNFRGDRIETKLFTKPKKYAFGDPKTAR